MGMFEEFSRQSMQDFIKELFVKILRESLEKFQEISLELILDEFLRK